MMYLLRKQLQSLVTFPVLKEKEDCLPTELHTSYHVWSIVSTSGGHILNLIRLQYDSLSNI